MSPEALEVEGSLPRLDISKSMILSGLLMKFADGRILQTILKRVTANVGCYVVLPDRQTRPKMEVARSTSLFQPPRNAGTTSWELDSHISNLAASIISRSRSY